MVFFGCVLHKVERGTDPVSENHSVLIEFDCKRLAKHVLNIISQIELRCMNWIMFANPTIPSLSMRFLINSSAKDALTIMTLSKSSAQVVLFTSMMLRI